MIFKYFHTLKYLKAIQIYGRIYSKIKKTFSAYNLPALKLIPNAISNKTSFINHTPGNSAENIRSNRFTFLNYSHSFENNINWNEKSLPLLWLFNLHYFSYLHLLDRSEQKKLVSNWIANNPVGLEPAWHPYPLSLRIINWIKSGIAHKAINENLYTQCAYLYRNLEFYHPANHYLENAKALIFGGIYFKGDPNADRWYKKGVKIYKDKLPEMILDDGCFFELSPMYHLIILEGLLDILNISIEETGDYSFFKQYAEKMLSFLPTITHPNGELVLFNDTTLEITPLPEEIIKYAARLEIYSKGKVHSGNSASDFYTYSNKNVFFIIDGGRIGPDHIPAHAHADIFTYELSYLGKKIITDSGVYEYASGEMRDYCRITMAHNTVSIDGISQAEMWGGFRVARRYYPENIKYEEQASRFVFEGVYTGYGKLIGDNLIHKRTVEIEKDSFQIIVKDEITGTGSHLVESFIHLHPDVLIKENDDYLVLSSDNISIKLSIFNSKFLIEEGWYCPEFGKRLKNKVIRIYSDQLPVVFSYSLCEDK